MNPAVDNSSELFSWAVPNFVEIRDLAQDKFGWSKQKVEEMIKPVIRAFDKKVIQKRIDSYFTRDNLAIKATQKPSKRVQAALSKVLGKTEESVATNITSTQTPKPKKTSTVSSKSKTRGSSSTATTVVPPQVAGPSKSNKELEAEKQLAARKEAIRVMQMKEDSRRKKSIAKRNARVEKKRIVVEEHKLSESDSD